MDYIEKEDFSNNLREYLKLLIPKEYASSIFTINLESLLKKGLKSIIVDLDDTLIPRREYKIPFSVYSWIEKVKECGFNICIVSNGSSSKRVEYIANSLNVKGFHFSLKPLPFILKKAISFLNTTPSKTVIIGDQILTDILGGNLLNAYTILVKPVAKETSILRLPLRFIEEKLIKLLKLEIDS